MGKHNDSSGRTGNNDQGNGRRRKDQQAGFSVGGTSAGRGKTSKNEDKGWGSNGDDDRNAGEDVTRRRKK